MKQVTINGKAYDIKYTIRALFIFEQITGKSFRIETLLDNYIFLYSMILANNEDVIDWDAFINAIDTDPSIIVKLNEVVTEQTKIDKLFNGNGDATDEKKS